MEEFMKEIKKWSVKDVITTVLLSAVLIVIQLLVNMVCMVNDFVSMVLSVGIATFLCAPVYMLMVSRKAVCDIDLYDASRHNFFPDGQLVFASLFYRRGLSL